MRTGPASSSTSRPVSTRPALPDLVAAGVILLFKTPPSDYRSPLRPFEEAAARRRLDPRSYYLFPDYVL